MESMEQVNSNFLMFVAEYSDIGPEDLEKLFYNGFDNAESMEMIEEKDLEELGIQDSQTVISKLRNVLELYNQNPPELLTNENQNVNQVDDTNFDTDTFPLIPDDARNLSKEILLGANQKKPRQMHREILESMTHLKMAQMKLSSLI